MSNLPLPVPEDTSNVILSQEEKRDSGPADFLIPNAETLYAIFTDATRDFFKHNTGPGTEFPSVPPWREDLSTTGTVWIGPVLEWWKIKTEPDPSIYVKLEPMQIKPPHQSRSSYWGTSREGHLEYGQLTNTGHVSFNVGSKNQGMCTDIADTLYEFWCRASNLIARKYAFNHIVPVQYTPTGEVVKKSNFTYSSSIVLEYSVNYSWYNYVESATLSEIRLFDQYLQTLC